MNALDIVLTSVWAAGLIIRLGYGGWIRSGSDLKATTYGRVQYYNWRGERIREKPSEEDYEHERIHGAKLIVGAPIWPILLTLLIARGLFEGSRKLGRSIGLTVKDALKELEQ